MDQHFNYIIKEAKIPASGFGGTQDAQEGTSKTRRRFENHRGNPPEATRQMQNELLHVQSNGGHEANRTEGDANWRRDALESSQMKKAENPGELG